MFYSDLFRDNLINYPTQSLVDGPNDDHPLVNVTIRPPVAPSAPPTQQNGKQKGLATSQVMKQRQALNPGIPGAPGAIRPEDKPDTPEYKKKQAMLKGPILEVSKENPEAYGMGECTFTGLRDIFLTLIQSQTRTGVLSPQRFLEIFKRDNEMFRNSMHQDAHEFYGLVLNDVITNVEANARRLQAQQLLNGDGGESNGLNQSVSNVIGAAALNAMTGYQSPKTGWVHDIFEGLLTSETQCLTCETGSQRDETFLDLSIDLEEHSSVTSCLRKFSEEEMLVERNKFHCDVCGGLQEAEKRMKVKRLPKVLTLHLKRFKYTEDYSRLQKLFHRVVYPYHLRMFNTTENAEDPDRLYELYAVVVHIGGNAYHGHYVSIIKTKDRGWVLFDDEMVEPVDKHFVRNFFGDKPGMATAYVLFYQETTFEKVRAEQEAEGMEEVMLANQAANVAAAGDEGPETILKRQATQPSMSAPEPETTRLARASTTPDISTAPALQPTISPIAEAEPEMQEMSPGKAEVKSKEDRKREKKEREAAEKAAEKAEKLAQKERERQAYEQRAQSVNARRQEQEDLQKVLEASKKTAVQEDKERKRENGGSSTMGFLDRSKRGSKSMAKRSFSLFGGKDKGDGMDLTNGTNGEHSDNGTKDKPTKGRISMSLGRKKSGFLS